MKHSFLHRIARQAGFTLIELLVAMAVLSIMLVGLATSMDYVSRLWLNGIGSMDNFTKARVVMNLLDRDIQMMVLRRDMAAFVDSTGANPACSFYSNVQGNPGGTLTAPDTRAVSLVQYVVVNPTTTPTLERLNYGMNFLTTSGATPTVGNVSSLPQPANTNLQTETVFTGIIALQIQFVDGTGAILTPPYIPTGSTSTTPVPFSYDFPTPGDVANPRAVIVSMLVLSNPAYNFAKNSSGGSSLTAVANMFLPANLPISSTSPTYSQTWNAFLNSSNASFLALPAQIRSGIQVFERHIPLPITTPSA